MSPHAKTLSVEITEIRGYCPTYQVGDTFKIEAAYRLISSKPVCMHALQGLTAYYIPLSREISPYDLGLASKDADQSSKEAYIQCHDPEHITGGGSVVFRVSVMD